MELSSFSKQTTASPENIGEIRTGSMLKRFIKTFAVSFVVSLVALYALGLVPAGFTDTPRQLYTAVASLFRSTEEKLISALPVPGVSNATTSTTVPSTSVSSNSYPLADVSALEPVSSDWIPYASVGGLNAPKELLIPSVGIRTPVVTPAATDISTLDTALLSGIVRYPSSGEAGERSNMLLFGHSSHLPVVHNPAFKALNGLEGVRLGDEIVVRTGQKDYRYRVYAVRLTTAQEEMISFRTDTRMLTLSTCNTFGSKSERFVVEAVFVGTTAI